MKSIDGINVRPIKYIKPITVVHVQRDNKIPVSVSISSKKGVWERLKRVLAHA